MKYSIIVDPKRITMRDILLCARKNREPSDMLLDSLLIMSRWLFDNELNEYVEEEDGMKHLLACNTSEIENYASELARYNENTELIINAINQI